MAVSVYYYRHDTRHQLLPCGDTHVVSYLKKLQGLEPNFFDP